MHSLPLENILDSPAMMHRWEFRGEGLVAVGRASIGAGLEAAWRRQGPPKATLPGLSLNLRGRLPGDSRAHRISDSFRLAAQRVIGPATSTINLNLTNIGPWLVPEMPMGPLHGHAGRLVSVQEGCTIFVELDRLTMQATGSLSWQTLVQSSVALRLASPHLVQLSDGMLVLLDEAFPSDILNGTRNASRFHIYKLTSEEPPERVAVFVAQHQIILAWTALQDAEKRPKAVICTCPWSAAVGEQHRGGIHVDLWDN